MNIWISDRIPISLMKEWNINKVITIKAGTGRGKSVWAMKQLYEHAKQMNRRILILQNRRAAESQFIRTIIKDSKQDVITVSKYQNLEMKLISLEPYYYIVCDEAHYFATDCAFNPKTDISYKEIIKHVGLKQIIFMTATGEGIFEMVKKEFEVISYDFGSDYSGINGITMFNTKDYIENKLSTLTQTGGKALIFLDKLENLIEMFGIFKDRSMLVCAQSRPEYKDLIDESLVESMTNTAKMQKQFLFATSALDTGFNLEDDTITDVFCASPDIFKIVQWIGRVRIQQGQKIHVHIKHVNKYQAIAKLKDLQETKAKLDALYRDIDEWKEMVYKTQIDHKMFSLPPRSNEIEINIMAEARLLRQIEFYTMIIKKDNFIEEIEKEFKIKIKFYERIQENNNLKEVLHSYLYLKLIGKETTKEFYNKLGLKKKYQDGSYTLIVKPNEANERIDELGYKIIKGTSRKGNYIQVVKLREEENG